eukprot:TRINITY_DN92380_c0_g1_i1.p1 TRINITY_DN92380_c0_g1~~TRINITY_DN92380_c0_g1_i1.p1  ORF type:complete len:349 (+),score=61.26 TRINITY_DN92380_c0_g1_i1:31-1077(+)
MATKRRPWAAALVAAARRRGFLRYLALLVPASSMAAALSTVAACLCIWRSGPHFLEGLTFPAISELGAQLPEKRLYQVGFTVCGGLLSLGLVLFEELVPDKLFPRGKELAPGARISLRGLQAAPHLNGSEGSCLKHDASSGRWTVRLTDGSEKALRPENLELRPHMDSQDEELLSGLLRWGHAASAGVVLQGVCTLSHDGLNAQNFVHWGGALLFMGSAQAHGRASNELYEKAARRRPGLLETVAVQWSSWLRHIISNYSSMVMFMLPLLVQFFPAASKTAPAASESSSSTEAASTGQEQLPMDPQMMNVMGLMQWGIILQFAVFFCTYTADLWVAAAEVASDPGKPE